MYDYLIFFIKSHFVCLKKIKQETKYDLIYILKLLPQADGTPAQARLLVVELIRDISLFNAEPR